MFWVGLEFIYVYFVYGDYGFGYMKFEVFKGQFDFCSVVQFIVDIVCKYLGEVIIVVIGLLGNLVLVFCLEFDLFKLVKGVSIMGGVVFVCGNVMLVVEVNIWNDVYVVEIVFGVDWNLIMFGLDVINDVLFKLLFVDVFVEKNFKLGGFVQESVQFYMDFYFQNCEDCVCFFYDVFFIVYLCYLEFFELIEGYVCVGIGFFDCG